MILNKGSFASGEIVASRRADASIARSLATTEPLSLPSVEKGVRSNLSFAKSKKDLQSKYFVLLVEIRGVAPLNS